jgi:hypothetical protein
MLNYISSYIPKVLRSLVEDWRNKRSQCTITRWYRSGHVVSLESSPSRHIQRPTNERVFAFSYSIPFSLWQSNHVQILQDQHGLIPCFGPNGRKPKFNHCCPDAEIAGCSGPRWLCCCPVLPLSSSPSPRSPIEQRYQPSRCERFHCTFFGHTMSSQWTCIEY